MVRSFSMNSTLVEFNECRLPDDHVKAPQDAAAGAAGRRRRREAIARAARAQFAELGYDRATFRAIATAAGVDPALVVHFFGSKEQLFHEVMALPPAAAPTRWRAWPRARETGRPPARGAHRRRAREPDDASDHRRADPLGAVTSRRSRARARDGDSRHPQAHSRARRRPTRTCARCLPARSVVGIALARYVVRVEPLASMSAADVVDYAAPLFQHCLVEPLRAGTAP